MDLILKETLGRSKPHCNVYNIDAKAMAGLQNIVIEQYQKLDHNFIEDKRVASTVVDWDLNRFNL